MLRIGLLRCIISESSFQAYHNEPTGSPGAPEQRGDHVNQAEFSSALETYWDTVYRVALNALGSAPDAEDAVQEVMLKFYTQACVRAKPFENDAHIKHWLIRTTINTCKGALRAFWRRNRVSLDDLAETQVFFSQEQSELFTAVMSLPEQHRTVLYLHYYEGYGTGELAGLLGLTEAHARTRLSRARNKLKEVWQDE